MTKKDLRDVAITAAIAATASTITGLLIAYFIERAKQSRQPELTPEEEMRAQAQALLNAQQQWLAGMGRCW